jgi:hypothetical protein
MPYRASGGLADTTGFQKFFVSDRQLGPQRRVESRRPQSETELLDSLRVTAAHVDPLPAVVRNRVRTAFVLAALERGLIGPGARRDTPPPPPAGS